MNENLRPTAITTDVEAGRATELTMLIETATYFANKWYGVTVILVDRTGNPETASIQAILPDSSMADLWDLDPVLWDDAHWAATRFVAVGDIAVFHPVLHTP